MNYPIYYRCDQRQIFYKIDTRYTGKGIRNFKEGPDVRMEYFTITRQTIELCEGAWQKHLTEIDKETYQTAVKEFLNWIQNALEKL